MNGLKINGMTLFLGQMPGRTGLCFHFQPEGLAQLFPVAYVPERYRQDAERFWLQFLGEKPPPSPEPVAGEIPSGAK